MFRLAIVECVVDTGCLELQKLVTNEDGEPEWVHYCIVRNAAQALGVVREKEPLALAQAERDLAAAEALGSKSEPLPNARIAKHLRGWVGDADRKSDVEALSDR
jgi:hypothetical protein